jgi:hypothetical protein
MARNTEEPVKTVDDRPKTPLLKLLYDLEDNVGIWAGAGESLLSQGHKTRTIAFAVAQGYIEIWRSDDDTNYYMLTTSGKCKLANEFWYPLVKKEYAEIEKSDGEK